MEMGGDVGHCGPADFKVRLLYHRNGHEFRFRVERKCNQPDHLAIDCCNAALANHIDTATWNVVHTANTDLDGCHLQGTEGASITRSRLGDDGTNSSLLVLFHSDKYHQELVPSEFNESSELVPSKFNESSELVCLTIYGNIGRIRLQREHHTSR
jgi:hypothetical protein